MTILNREQLYLYMPSDLRLIVFDLEHEMGIPVGGGDIFKKREVDIGKKRHGRVLDAQEAMTRHLAMFIATKYLKYPASFIAKKFMCSVPLIYHANKVVSGLMDTMPRYRKILYNIACKNGLMDLADEIEQITKEREKIKKAFQTRESFYEVRRDAPGG